MPGEVLFATCQEARSRKGLFLSFDFRSSFLAMAEKKLNGQFICGRFKRAREGVDEENNNKICHRF